MSHIFSLYSVNMKYNRLTEYGTSFSRRRMLSQVIWWIGIALELLLLIRGLWGRLFFRYPAFYSYISFVLCQSLLRQSVLRWNYPLYANLYWTTEFLGVLIGCGIVFEIYRIGLSAYPGTARMARSALSLVFALAVLEALMNTQWWRIATVWGLERNLRVVQALAIAALVLLFLFYSIRFGKNLNGILLGYSLFVGMSVIQLTFVSPAGTRFSDFWSYLHPLSYDLALAMWAGCLWSYQGCPEPEPGVRLEQEYQRIAAVTQRRLQETRGYLRKAVRP